MNILFSPAHYYVSDYLGTEVSWPFYALEALAQQGHEIWAICGYCDNVGKLPANVHLTVIYPGKRGRNALVEWRRKLNFYWRVAVETRRIMKEQNIDVVHHFAPISPQSPNLSALRGELKKVPFTIGPAMIPPLRHGELSSGLGVRADWRLGLTAGLLKLIERPAFALHRRTLKKADLIFATTDEAAAYYRRFVPHDKVQVEPAGIKISTYEVKNKTHNPRIILALSYLTPRKGVDVLIKAFPLVLKRHPKARLWIVGDGPSRAELAKLADETGLADKIRFWGFIKNTNVGRYYAEAGIFCSPTRYEPFGQTLLEAMAAGLPIVASHTGAVPTIISPDVGLTFPVDDVDKLAQRLINLLGNKDMMDRMGRAGVARVKDKYSWSNIMTDYVAAWRCLISAKKTK